MCLVTRVLKIWELIQQVEKVDFLKPDLFLKKADDSKRRYHGHVPDFHRMSTWSELGDCNILEYKRLLRSITVTITYAC